MGVITVVGLGPAGPELLSARTVELLAAGPSILRTRRHPAAAAYAHLESYDEFYERAETFESLYREIADDLVARSAHGPIVYAVPGAPTVAEHTVELLLADPRVEVRLEPALSFCELAWSRLALDPVAAQVTIADATDLLGENPPSGAVLVAQVWSDVLLSAVRLELLDRQVDEVVVLHHLGLDDELVATVEVGGLSRAVTPDHLTSLYVANLENPGRSVQRLLQLCRRLRAECPWDQVQTHSSLGRHLLEEAHEVLQALDDLEAAEASAASGPTATSVPTVEAAVAHVEEELGDLLVQVVFHAILAEEEDRFDLAAVAEAVRAKLIYRHPHVFGEVEAESAEAVAANWEILKRAEKGRDSVVEGIPTSLPALALVTKLQRKAEAIGFPHPESAAIGQVAASRLAALVEAASGSVESTTAESAEVGALLEEICVLAQRSGVDPEAALRRAATQLARSIRAAELGGDGRSAPGDGGSVDGDDSNEGAP